MGNSQNKFDSQFHSLYSYIQSINDNTFGYVKIYRKNCYKYDYIMVMEIPYSYLKPSSSKIFIQKVKQIKKQQGESTMKIHQLKTFQNGISSCQNGKVTLFADYLNRTLDDYLIALRNNPILSFEIEQIIYVVKQTVKTAVILEKMGIKKFHINTKTIFLTIEGEIALSPLLYLLQQLKQTDLNKNETWLIHQNYELGESDQNFYPCFKREIKNLLLQLSGYLDCRKGKRIGIILSLIEESKSVMDLNRKMPMAFCDHIRLEQMYVNN